MDLELTGGSEKRAWLGIPIGTYKREMGTMPSKSMCGRIAKSFKPFSPFKATFISAWQHYLQRHQGIQSTYLDPQKFCDTWTQWIVKTTTQVQQVPGPEVEEYMDGQRLRFRPKATQGGAA